MIHVEFVPSPTYAHQPFILLFLVIVAKKTIVWLSGAGMAGETDPHLESGSFVTQEGQTRPGLNFRPRKPGSQYLLMLLLFLPRTRGAYYVTFPPQKQDSRTTVLYVKQR